MKKAIGWIMAWMLLLTGTLGGLSARAEEDDDSTVVITGDTIIIGAGGITVYTDESEEAEDDDWTEYDYQTITVGNPTPMEGKFFTTLWGGSTSDLDAQELLHGYCLVKWDTETGRTRFDRSVVSGAAITDDEEGNRTYYISVQEDLLFSDGTPITAVNYLFGLLFSIDPAIGETGGTPVDGSWILGYDEYISGESETVRGLRLLGDYQMSITAKAEALPYFYELERLSLKPFPIGVISPGHRVVDEGSGARIIPALTSIEIQIQVLDAERGYLRRPSVVSGPYTLEEFDGKKAVFHVNEYYKGNEEGRKPLLADLEYTVANNQRMIEQLGAGEYALLNKVTLADTLLAGIRLAQQEGHQYTMTSYPRAGLSLIWFNENSVKAQERAVRQAVAYCLDRESFIRQYVGPFGMAVDGYYGLGQWMYQILSGAATYETQTGEEPTAEELAVQERASVEIESLNLDGLTKYTLDMDRANQILDAAGWTLDQGGGNWQPGYGDIRYKLVGNQLMRLRLIMAVPENPEAAAAMQEIFVPVLKEAGIELRLETVSMEQVETYHNDEGEGIDMVYLGENFGAGFNPEVFHSTGESEIARDQMEIYALATDMVKTAPEDIPGFLRKWVAVQEKISENLPLIPVYSNVYFDFYTRELFDYHIDRYASWAEAIVPAYLSVPEAYDDSRNDAIDEELIEMEAQFE